MKSKLVLIVIIAFSVLVGLSMSACKDDPPSIPVTLVRIDVTQGPAKTVYIVGEELDLTGLVITASYSNKTSKEVAGYTVKDYDKNLVANQTILVEYQKKSASFTVIVIEPPGENQIVLAGTIHLKVDGEFPSWENNQPELLLLPDWKDGWDAGEFLPLTNVTTDNFQWFINVWDLDNTTPQKFYFWVWAEGADGFKTNVSIDLASSDNGKIKQGININVDILTKVKIQGTVAVVNPNVKSFLLEVFEGDIGIDSKFIDLDDSNSFTIEIGNRLKGTELTFKIRGANETGGTLTINSKNENVSLNFNLTSFTSADMWVGIRDAFDTNSNLFLYNWPVNDQDGRLRVNVDDSNIYEPEPTREYLLYVNGVSKVINIEKDYNSILFYLSTSDLAAGWNYGTFIVVINGTPFAKDFSFWVNK